MPSAADSPEQGLDLFLPHQRGCFPRPPTMPVGEQSHRSHPSLLGQMGGLWAVPALMLLPRCQSAERSRGKLRPRR